MNISEKLDFTGKTILIIGGSRGIGRACAENFAKLGGTVVVTYNQNVGAAERLATDIEKIGRHIKCCHLDVSNIEEIRKVVKLVTEEYGALDVLVNSAGISQIIAAPDITEKDWDQMMTVNLKGTFFSCQEALKVMMAQKKGRIVNLASTAGQMGGFMVGVNYSVSKAGVICLTKSLAKYAAPFGVGINCVAPGLINTDMISDYPEEKVLNMVSAIPLKRMGLAQEVSDSIVFLASEASSYITGSTFYVNGGTYLG